MKLSRYATLFTVIISIFALAACSATTKQKPLAFSTAASAMVHAGAHSALNIQVNDSAATIHEAGPMPAGLIFRSGENGSASISGVPGGDAGGHYRVRLTATDGLATATQNLEIAVDEKPYFPSLDNTTFGANEYHGNSDMIVATGYPMPKITYSGTLPGGFTFKQTGVGIVTLSGSPGTTEGPCDSQVTIKAVSASGTATLPVLIKIGDWRCVCNVACAWFSQHAVQLGNLIFGKQGAKVGEWFVQQGKAVAAMIWVRGRALFTSPQTEQALAQDAESIGSAA